jgi:hypothetical protein
MGVLFMLFLFILFCFLDFKLQKILETLIAIHKEKKLK